MARDRRLAEWEVRTELAGVAFALGEELDDAASGRIGQGGQRVYRDKYNRSVIEGKSLRSGA